MLITGDNDGHIIMHDMRELGSTLARFTTDTYLTSLRPSQQADSIITVLPDHISVYELNGSDVCSLPILNTS
jgi:hypothetical protein